MKKLFDIPIYALSQDELSHRVKQKIDKLKEYAAGTDPQTMNLIIDNLILPESRACPILDCLCFI